MHPLFHYTQSFIRAFPRLLRTRIMRGKLDIQALQRRGLRVRFVYPDIGAPTRYRVYHQIEQARLAGLQPEGVSINQPERLYDLSGSDLLYLYRMPLAPRTASLLVAARLLGVPVVFDTDDLTWDEQERSYGFLDTHYQSEVVSRILRTARRTRALMRLVDAFIVTTPYLAGLAAQSFRQVAYVNANAVSQAMVELSEQAIANRQANQDRVIIGYFSGQAHIHDEDMATITPALCRVLERFPHVTLRICGELELRDALAGPAYAGQIERRAAVEWQALPQEIAQVSINIAPLVDNPQRRAKSAVKYLEAALCAVPTVAVRLEPYQDTVADGRTGLLAGNDEEWTEALTRLITDPALRTSLGNAAREHVLSRHTTTARAPFFASILAQVVAKANGFDYVP